MLFMGLDPLALIPPVASNVKTRVREMSIQVAWTCRQIWKINSILLLAC